MELFKLFCNFYSEINKMAKDVKKWKKCWFRAIFNIHF